MNGKELLESMGYVDEKYIDEAEDAPAKRRVHFWPLAVAASAACLVLVLAGVWTVLPAREAEQASDAAPMVAATFQAERNEVMEDRSVAVEEAEGETAVAAGTPMMLSALAEMTVRVVEQEGDALLCVVTDPGNSDYQVNDQVKIALPEVAAQASGSTSSAQGKRAPAADSNSLAETQAEADSSDTGAQSFALEKDAPSADVVTSGATEAPVLYQVSFLPDQGTDIIQAAQWMPLDEIG